MNNKIGITERGDASIDFSWVEKLNTVAMAIIITKNVTDKVIDNLLKNKNKIILHATVTGFGGTDIEPFVPKPEESLKQINKLISLGFPKEQIVLRVDPIIPSDKGIETACKVLELFSDTGIERIRYSFIDMYDHVRERFINKNIAVPWESFTAPISKRLLAEYALSSFDKVYNFECCAEDSENAIGCISEKDTEVLGLGIELEGKANQRKSCLCPGNKTELLSKAKRCAYKCLYCYWWD